MAYPVETMVSVEKYLSTVYKPDCDYTGISGSCSGQIASGSRDTLGGHPKPANEGQLKTGQRN